ncbi:hypothetical protein NDU88_003977 [Pleurodeles waltl]|uniref:Uncharacterized protein n=1 Tax=Pleurodeles waltl TaxID=8319 RepID=A0AAV7PCP4_PLEWA|nr:hypothetical protein NDU88_003977 [Pleurodeles waltl]
MLSQPDTLVLPSQPSQQDALPRGAHASSWNQPVQLFTSGNIVSVGGSEVLLHLPSFQELLPAQTPVAHLMPQSMWAPPSGSSHHRCRLVTPELAYGVLKAVKIAQGAPDKVSATEGPSATWAVSCVSSAAVSTGQPAVRAEWHYSVTAESQEYRQATELPGSRGHRFLQLWELD